MAEKESEPIIVTHAVYNKLFLRPEKTFSGLPTDHSNHWERQAFNILKAIASDNEIPNCLAYIMIYFPRCKNAGKGTFKFLVEWAEQEHGIPREVSDALFYRGNKAYKKKIRESDLLKIAKGLFEVKG